ncbi:MAG: hypothetical protein Q9227_003274 [Pyrenula ochraceoflavens]
MASSLSSSQGSKSPGGSQTPSSATSIGDNDGVMPIAVVGMSFRGPKDATSVENLWTMISEGREGWSPVPESRWNNKAFYHPNHSRHGTTNVEGGHFFEEDLSRFDAPFFNMTNAEATALDPQQRLLLEGTYEAVENAGIPLSKIMGSKTSCFAGSFSGDYTDLLVRDPEATPMYQCTNAGQSRAMTANRVSYFFDLRGPSVTVDTACSGSLVALHLACQSLQTGDAKLALACGVNTILSHEFMTTLSMMRFLSPDGRCYTFDERANGYARGEGVGCLLLKPLVDALRDNDPIRAVIRGTGSNQDGRTQGISLPSAAAQEQLIRDVYQTAALDPLETEYVECHGTGTQAGDPLETGALSKVFSPNRNDDQPLRIGSIKTNVGHLEGASGIAGVIKAVMMLEKERFLPNRNFERLNPRIALKDWKLKIQLENEQWNTDSPHRISVNSFGYGGSNAHAILEDAKGYLARNFSYTSHRQGLGLTSTSSSREVKESPGPSRVRLFVISGFDEDSCKQQSERLCNYLERYQGRIDDHTLSSLAYTLAERRSHFSFQTLIAAGSVQDLIEGLKKRPKVSRVKRKKPTLGFIFTGQGAQWCGMGRELLAAYPIFATRIETISSYLRNLGAPFDVREELERDAKGSKINEPLYSQTICTAIQIALVDLLASWGVRPASVTGHSSGEIACAYVAGALSSEHAMAVAYYRGVASSALLDTNDQQGAMMAVGWPENNVQPLLASLTKGTAVVACVNSPSSVTVSGDVLAIEELQGQLEQEGVFARKLAVDVAYHSHHMNAVADRYRRDLLAAGVDAAGQVSGQADVEVFSSVTGKKTSPHDLGPDYWVSNLLSQVKFAQAVSCLCLETTASGQTRRPKTKPGAANKAKVDMLVEIGPHSALAGPIRQILQADSVLDKSSIDYASSLVRKSSALDSTLALATALLCAGQALDLAAVNRPTGDEHPSVLVDFPPYAWNHSRSYWAESRLSKAYRNRAHPRLDLLGVPDAHSMPLEPRWRNYLRMSEMPWLEDHKIQSNVVYPAAGFICMAVEAVRQHIHNRLPDTQIEGYRLRNVAIESALVISDDSEPEVWFSLRPSSEESLDAAQQWHEFTVQSVTQDERWTEHCRGFICIETAIEDERLARRVSQTMSKVEPLCQQLVDVASFYKQLTEIGLEYGETFANISHMRSAPNACIAELQSADTATVMPAEYQHPFVVHPSTLDSVFHPIFAALSADNALRNPAVPTALEEIWIKNDVLSNVGHRFRSCTRILRTGQDHVQADIGVVDAVSSSIRPVLEITGLTCKILEQPPDVFEDEKQPARLAYQIVWDADVDLLSPNDLVRLGNNRGVYEAVARYAKLQGHKNPFLEVLEVGDGGEDLYLALVGALTAVENGTPMLKSYAISNPAAGLEKDFAERVREVVKHKLLDAATDPLQQGFDAHSLDLILLHHGQRWSDDTRTSIAKHAWQLLGPRGKLVLIDDAEKQLWRRALLKGRPAGKEVVFATLGTSEDNVSACIATLEDSEQPPSQSPEVLIIVEEQEQTVSLPELQRLLSDAHLRTSVTSFAHADPEGKACIVLSELSGSVLGSANTSTFDTTKNILTGGSNGVLWVVRGATTSNPTGNLANGLLRTVRSEVEGDRPIVSLDLDTVNQVNPESAAKTIFSLFNHHFLSARKSQEVEFSERDGVLRIPRIVESPAVSDQVASYLAPIASEQQAFFQSERPLQLSVSSPGDLSTCVFVDALTEADLAEGHVEIEVKAFGLSGIDLKITEGQVLNTDRIGTGCSGIVTRVADNVTTFRTGDRVATFEMGTAASMFRAPSEDFQHIPSDMSFEDAAMLPRAYIAAFFAVNELARVKRGERVVIQNAASAMGQALVGLCLVIGAQLILAVDSEEQRTFFVDECGMAKDQVLVGLRERRLATGIVGLAGEKGADVVFSFSRGEERRLILSGIAPYGRFIELDSGPTKSDDASAMDMTSVLARNASFASLDARYLFEHKPQTVRQIWVDLMHMVRYTAMGRHHKLRVHSISQAEDALKELQTNNGMDSIVIRTDRNATVKVVSQAKPSRTQSLFREDASYMLVGGLGGIGRAVARWMINNGARNLIFVNRSGLSRQEARDSVEALENQGAKVWVSACDVTDSEQLSQAVSESSSKMPPIRGVIHTAMVLRDTLFTKMTVEDFHAVLQPKFRGVWNLHEHLPQDMDFFVMLSSISGVIGNATQGAYAAGSTFLDAFAEYRSSLGLHTVTLDLGVITGVGYLSQHDELLAGMRRQGFEGTNEETLVALIRFGITNPCRSGISPHVVTGLGTWSPGVSLGNFELPLFAHFRRQALGLHSNAVQGAGESIRESLQACKTMEDATNLVCDALVGRLAARLNIAADGIDLQGTSSEYGVDSLVAVELRNWCSRDMESTMPILELVANQSIYQLSTKIAQRSKLVSLGQG